MKHTHQLRFMRRVGQRCWEIPIGRIHGHRKLGFDAATRANGHAPLEIDDYYWAHQQADALNANLADCDISGLRGCVFVVAI